MFAGKRPVPSSVRRTNYQVEEEPQAMAIVLLLIPSSHVYWFRFVFPRKMDKTTKSVYSSCNDDGVPEETRMDKVLSDLHALKKLYGLLQRLDETSSALLKKLLDDATRQALLKQAKALTTAPDPVIPFSLGSMSQKKMDQATPSSSSFCNNNLPEETEMEQILSDLQALTSLYRLLHKDPADEHLDEASSALLMKILEDATKEAVQRQAKMLSGSVMPPALERKLSIRSDCRTRQADPRLGLRPPLASPSPSLLASARSRRLDLQHSTVSSRSGRRVDGHRYAAEEPPLARLASHRSSRTALPARHGPSQEHWQSGLSLHHFPVGGTSRHGTVAGSTSTRRAGRRDSIRRSTGRGDQWSLERSSSSRRSVSRELSLGPTRLHRGRATPRHVRAESSSSAHLLERLDSGLSQGMTSRRGVGNAGRGVATPDHSSSSDTMVTIQSRIRPSSTLLMERSLRRSAEEGGTSRWRRGEGSGVSSADMYSSMYSGGGGGRSSSSGADSLSTSRSPTVSPPASRGFAPYYYSPVMPRGIAPPVYAPEVPRSMSWRRRRQERLERRVARLRMLKNKIATVFHHRHDHHHHHHLGGGQEGPSTTSRGLGADHLKSPWQYLTRMFHGAKGKINEKARSRAVVGVPEKRRGGGGNVHSLFDAVRRRLKGKRRAPAGLKLRRKASRRVQVKKMHWWPRLKQRHGSKPRRRLGYGKTV